MRLSTMELQSGDVKKQGKQRQMRSRKRERGKKWKKHFSNKSLDQQR